ncbi:hypothetical protein [Brumimicrobium oceani]|uniref:Uncharacterized protein n=1 Tax=Brumimicrobium oceani TaxID=2100725 RepID=A0A2U2XEL9_9FLAO|nr:hypothetical protein [Brumimicrobium oceani]PWH86242.1 hypothetical protein DIT68_03095 [Brumimicrobium oceani]PWH86249.1 hypothetical protein DIT68_03135 [Brumimicrobium oceani]
MRNISFSLLVILGFSVISCSGSLEKNKALQKQITLLKSKNDSLNHIIDNNVWITDKFNSEGNLVPITLSRSIDYILGDTVKIYGTLGIQDVDNLSLSVNIEGGINIKVDSTLFWTYNYVPTATGIDKLEGYYLLNIKGNKSRLMFKHLLHVHDNKNSLLKSITGDN